MVKNLSKIYAIVPARGGSKGIKLKNLKKINGKSLIEITSRFIDKSRIFSKKILSTDSKKIIKIGKRLNFEIVKRPKNLSGDRVSDYKVIEHCLKNLKKKDVPEYIAYLQPTSPTRKINHLIAAYRTVKRKNYQSAWSVNVVNKKFHPLKTLRIKNNNLKIYLDEGKNIIARQSLDDIYTRNGVFYIFKVSSLLKQKTIYLKKIYPSITNYPISNIDTKDDLKKAKKLMSLSFSFK